MRRRAAPGRHEAGRQAPAREHEERQTTDFNRRQALAGAAPAGVPRRRSAQGRVIRIGALADFSGPYRSTSGPTALAEVQQAIGDLGLARRGIRVEVVQGDHLNRPDAALALTRR